jgi:hypothetical protein
VAAFVAVLAPVDMEKGLERGFGTPQIAVSGAKGALGAGTLAAGASLCCCLVLVGGLALEPIDVAEGLGDKFCRGGGCKAGGSDEAEGIEAVKEAGAATVTAGTVSVLSGACAVGTELFVFLAGSGAAVGGTFLVVSAEGFSGAC